MSFKITTCFALMALATLGAQTAAAQSATDAATQPAADTFEAAETLFVGQRTTGPYSEIVEASKLSGNYGDLKDIIVSSFEYHPQLKALRAQSRASRENIAEARASYLPQISLDSAISISNRDVLLQTGSGFDQNVTPRNFALRLNQTLYNGGRRGLASRNALITSQVSQAEFQNAARAIAAEIINDYIALMAAEAETTALNQSVLTLIDLEKSVLARKSAGDATQTEVSQALSRLAAARARRESARAAVSNARSRLLSKTGFLIQNPKLPDEATQPISFSLQDILAKARLSSPVVASSKLNEESAKIALQQETRKRLPTVSLSANASTARDTTPTTIRDDDVNVGLTLTMPLYTGGAGKAQTRRAAAQYQAAKYQADEALRQVRLQVTQLWTQLESGKSSLEAQKASVAASEDALKGVSAAQLAGLSTTQDVLDATQIKLNADIALAQAEFSQYSTRLLLRLFIGELELYEFDL